MARLQRLVTEAPPKQGEAIRAILGLLGGATQADGWWYRELSIGYVAEAAGCGWETARRAWQTVRQILGWWSVAPQLARDLGARVRSLASGCLWGQHLLLCDGTVSAVRAVVPPVQAPVSEDWRPLDVIVRPGGRLSARCPWHDDRTPSALLHQNQDGRSGPGVCLRCVDATGQPLRFFWVRDRGRYRARPARGSGGQGRDRGTVPGSPSPIPSGSSPGGLDSAGSSYGSETGTIYRYPHPGRPDPTPPTGPRTRTLGTLSGTMTLRETRATDYSLLALLRRADAQADREPEIRRLEAQAARWHYSAEADARRYVPDLYLGVDEVEPCRWQSFSLADGRRVVRPCGWEPVAASHVLVDLDGFDSSPVGSRELEAAGARLARWASEHPALSGEVAVVRTSPGGVQVAFGLRDRRADPRSWWRSSEARTLARELDAIALQEVRAAGFGGGHADPCVHAAGRMMRRPGPRIAKDGLPYVARLVFSCDATTEER